MAMSDDPLWLLNPAARRADGFRGLFDASDYADVARFFAGRIDLTPTPLRRLPSLAMWLGIGELWLKDESTRFDLDAFKIAGVWYAVDRLKREDGIRPPRDGGDRPVLVTASTGNHGRAVARVAARSGFRARIFVPAGTVPHRVASIAAEGAEPVMVEGTYEQAVARAATEADGHGWTVVSDTTYPGYDRIPRLIMAGYTWLLTESAAQWAPSPPPDVVLVQAGVGGLAGAVASWVAFRYGEERPFVIACEATGAACVLASVRAGHPVTLIDPVRTMMAGLRCAQPSTAAWPAMSAGIDACVAVSDASSVAAMRRLARPAGRDPVVVAGPSGACGLAVLDALATEPGLAPLRRACNLQNRSRVLVINTEGNTDPDLYRREVGECA